MPLLCFHHCPKPPSYQTRPSVPGMFDGQAEIAVEIEASVKSYISLKAVISVVTGVLVRMRH